MSNRKKVSTTKLIFLIVLLLIFVFIMLFTFTKDCGNDKACFEESFSNCAKSKLVFEDDGSVFSYEIQGSNNESCVMTIFMDKVSSKSKSYLKENLEGKGMVCEVASDVGSSLYEVDEMSSFCTGPLKEVLLRISLERLYSFVVSTFNPELLVELNNQLDVPAISVGK